MKNLQFVLSAAWMDDDKPGQEHLHIRICPESNLPAYDWDHYTGKVPIPEKSLMEAVEDMLSRIETGDNLYLRIPGVEQFEYLVESSIQICDPNGMLGEAKRSFNSVWNEIRNVMMQASLAETIRNEPTKELNQ